MVEYKYVDKSHEVRKEEEEKERTRLDSKRREKEKRERERIQREIDETERKLSQQVERQRKELLDYKFGEKIAIASFEGLDISDVTKDKAFKIRIGVFGPTGSGKSSFVNTCERAVREKEKGLAPVQPVGEEGTVVLEEFLGGVVPLCLVDTRGFFHYDRNEKWVFLDILHGRIKPGHNIKRSSESSSTDGSESETPFKERLHSIILVVKANDPRLTEGALRDYLNPNRKILQSMGMCYSI